MDGQEAGKSKRGRKLSDGGARARFYHEVCEAHLARIVRIDLKSELFTYTIDERALTHARLMDGKLLLVTNTTDLTPEDRLHEKEDDHVQRDAGQARSEAAWAERRWTWRPGATCRCWARR